MVQCKVFELFSQGLRGAITLCEQRRQVESEDLCRIALKKFQKKSKTLL